MIASLRGTLIEKGPGGAVVEAAGVGYEVALAPSTTARLPREGSEVHLHVCESVAMYGGGTTLYGFATREDKQLFLCFKDLPATGAKKALEHLDKASRSLPDFRRAILDADAKLLKTMFGFTPKTADRLIRGLADKLGGLPAKTARRPAGASPVESGPLAQAVNALSALGYRPPECRSALEAVQRDLGGRDASVEEIVRLALRRL